MALERAIVLSALEKIDINNDYSSSMDVYMLGQSPLHMLSGSVSRDTDVGPIVILRQETAETLGVFHPGITIRTEQEAQNVITFLRMAFPPVADLEP